MRTSSIPPLHVELYALNALRETIGRYCELLQETGQHVDEDPVQRACRQDLDHEFLTWHELYGEL